MEKKGKLIVIEGIDGSGKKTQAGMLKARLEQLDVQCELISFPRYGEPPAYFIEKYLKPGSPYGSPQQVGPRRASIFYALDRYDASFFMKGLLSSGAFVVADRYFVSNAAHQGGKIADEKEREGFVQWLYDLEYGLFEIPKPDINIILTLPVDVASHRVLGKQARLYLDGKAGAKDAHEEDLSHLLRAQEAYVWVAKKHPDEFRIIECVPGGGELTTEEVHKKIWNVVQEVIKT